MAAGLTFAGSKVAASMTLSGERVTRSKNSFSLGARGVLSRTWKAKFIPSWTLQLLCISVFVRQALPC
jgi:hypothetical protein